MRLVDTSVAIDHLCDYAPAVQLLEHLLRSRQALVASEVVRFELLAGARPSSLPQVETLSSALEWIPVTEAVARKAGELARRYRPAHSGIDDADYFIAATAEVMGIPLLTRNVRHFPMFPGLRPPY